MRQFFTWMVTLGILAGCFTRSLAADPCEVIITMHAQEHSDHHHDPGQPCDPAHDEKCPMESHHQGLCGHVMPLTAELQKYARPKAPGFSLTPVRSEAAVPPDGPFAELDKPPLI